MKDAVGVSNKFRQLRVSVDQRLTDLLFDSSQAPTPLVDAARYALLAPGKRFRPLLTLLTAQAMGTEDLTGLDVACAMEMVHVASLVLDDLPCMDDAQWRRGLPATHKVFGESTAILAAIALLSKAYEVIGAEVSMSAQARARLIQTLAQAVGFGGLAAGQVRDLQRRQVRPSLADIDRLNHEKTGVLIIASAQAGAWIADAAEDRVQALRAFAGALGLAFQIRDDLIDQTSTTAVTGKDVGRDDGMATLVSTLGPIAARQVMLTHLVTARESLSRAGIANSPLTTFVEAYFEPDQAAA